MIEKIKNSIIKIAEKADSLDKIGLNTESDNIDRILQKTAQVIQNPTQQQINFLMFNINQLNERIKQIEESVGGNNQQIQQNLIEPINEAQYTSNPPAQTPQNNMQVGDQTITHNAGDFQVTIGPNL